MTRGWTSQELTAVGDDARLWTITDAARHLGPLPGDPDDTPLDVTVTKLRNLTRYHHYQVPPAGKRRSTRPGQPGRYARVYRSADFIALYELMDPDNEEKPPAAA
jgi:hypothetical protein